LLNIKQYLGYFECSWVNFFEIQANTNFFNQPLNKVFGELNKELWEDLCGVQSTFYINTTHFKEYVPEILLLSGLLLLLIYSVFLRGEYTRRVTTVQIYSYTLLLLAVVFLYMLFSGTPVHSTYLFNYMLMNNSYVYTLKLIILGFSILLMVVAKNFLLKDSKKDTIEYLLLVGYAILLMFILVSSINIITAFLALEGVTIIVYVLSIFPFTRYNFEATVKYFYLSALASSFLLYSFSLIYGLTGSCNFITIKYFIYRDALNGESNMILQMILLCLIVSFLFKVGAFPAHW
jgi:NADH-quinone oxidoreductase subunit N